MQDRATPPRPTLIASGIGAAAQFLFTLNLTRPTSLVFDEVHYVPAARLLMTLSHSANTEHPLLGKLLIALGMTLFGDNALGWRIMSTVAATTVVLGVFAILWMLFQRTRTAVFGALFVILNFTVFIQARIAMLDGFMAAFVVLAIVALLRAMRSPPRKVMRRWVLGSALLGLAVATKWTAAPFVAYAAIGFLLVRRRDATAWPGLRPIPALLILGTVSIATYFLTFAPAFYYAEQPLTLDRLIPFQLYMYGQQTQVLPPHPYQSSWWSWPLMIRPIWYLYEMTNGAVRGILLLGNPAILWGGLIAVAACLRIALRERSIKFLAIAALWIGSYAIWAIIPKSLGFFYYYYLPSIFLCIALAAWIDHRRGKWRYWGLQWDWAYLALVAGLFVMFYPIISAAALPNDQAFRHWMWFSSWP
ncbi:phospholipid carrier-dependent glycosyltransferase [Sphingomonas sp. So64.6b]|uniref:glycosyltransferase family 39 protein n=1 Tax=Sphingomonas sp. So64.6b TaxID=2997354 RepID=UPI0015FFE1A3|nr:glycosyltransferase family 39 protein [Sphingomonas sp. So64.6b]QNA84817.1 phospholipid carrier-dependent glycosyltransferase [Sphingomonas sp. So64.6b]